MLRLPQLFLVAILAVCPPEVRAHADGWPFTATSSDAWVLAGVIVSAWWYCLGMLRLRVRSHDGAALSHRRAVSYFTGVAILLAALASPLDTMAGELFSAHMVQHELLMLAAAPLLVAGRPLPVFFRALAPAWRRRIGAVIGRRATQSAWMVLTAPLTAWALHAVILWIWHVPVLFQIALRDDAWHAVQHLGFLASALLFWSSLPWTRSRRRDGVSVLSILTTAIHTGVLGALLTFSPRAWYPAYGGRTEAWGWTLLEDQQLGGLVMWVPAGFMFVFTGLVFAARAVRPAAIESRIPG